MTRPRLKPEARRTLEAIADLAVSGKTRDEALLHIEEMLEENGIVRAWIGSRIPGPDMTDPDVHQGTWP